MKGKGDCCGIFACRKADKSYSLLIFFWIFREIVWTVYINIKKDLLEKLRDDTLKKLEDYNNH